MEKKWLRPEKEGIQVISEDIWNHAAVPKRSVMKYLVQLLKIIVIAEILLFGWILIQIMLAPVGGQNDRMWKEILGQAFSIIAILIFLSYCNGENRVYAYLFVRKSIQIWMRRMRYKAALTEEGVWVSACGKTLRWQWEQIEWYQWYGRTAIMGVGGYYIYMEMSSLNPEEKKQYHRMLLEKAGQGQMPELYAMSYIWGLKRLYKYAKKMK